MVIILDHECRTDILIDACMNGKFQNKTIDEALQNGADPNATNEYGFTPLMFCILNKNRVGAKLLIEAGADVNYSFGDWKTMYELDAWNNLVLPPLMDNDSVSDVENMHPVCHCAQEPLDSEMGGVHDIGVREPHVVVEDHETSGVE